MNKNIKEERHFRITDYIEKDIDGMPSMIEVSRRYETTEGRKEIITRWYAQVTDIQIDVLNAIYDLVTGSEEEPHSWEYPGQVAQAVRFFVNKKKMG